MIKVLKSGRARVITLLPVRRSELTKRSRAKQ
jgi:hypothetical protein